MKEETKMKEEPTMNDNLVGRYICKRNETGDFDSFYFLTAYHGWDHYRARIPELGERTIPVHDSDKVFDTIEEAAAFANYLNSDELMMSIENIQSDENERHYAKIEWEWQQAEEEKELEARLRECEVAVMENPTEENLSALKEAYQFRREELGDIPF